MPTTIELEDEYWIIVRQVLETALTAKGSEGARMLCEIYNAFDEAGIVVPVVDESTA